MGRKKTNELFSRLNPVRAIGSALADPLEAEDPPMAEHPVNSV